MISLGVLIPPSIVRGNASTTFAATTTTAASTSVTTSAARVFRLELGINAPHQGAGHRCTVRVFLHLVRSVVDSGRLGWRSRPGSVKTLDRVLPARIHRSWLVWLSSLIVLVLRRWNAMLLQLAILWQVTSSHAGITGIVVNVAGVRAHAGQGQEDHGSVLRLRVDHGGQCIVGILFVHRSVNFFIRVLTCRRSGRPGEFTLEGRPGIS
mmetsp:Transcript_32449/g.68231  ORF Transcript_32449/g.68231 Transcript_32449/m.68231 type:complete len:209 (+) Transcript_32449:1446-2072(+)